MLMHAQIKRCFSFQSILAFWNVALGSIIKAALRADVEMTISLGRARGQLPGADEGPLVKIAWT